MVSEVSIEGELAKIEKLKDQLKDLKKEAEWAYNYEDIAKINEKLEDIVKELDETTYRLRQLLKLKQVI